MSDAQEPKNGGGKLDPSKRHSARVAAVQATYQIDATGMPADRVMAEFVEHRISSPEARSSYGEADPAFFSELVRGVSDARTRIDEAIEGALTKGWTAARIDRVLHAILRCGAFEILCRADIPPKVAINEYVDVARAFFDGDEPGFVNGVLDTIGRKTRAAEMEKNSGAAFAGTG
jgi:transcription antitermination protein NusB